MNERNLSLLCDYYELTMSNGYFKKGMADRIAYFDVFFRTVPDGGGFAVAAGLEQVVDYINLFFVPDKTWSLRVDQINRNLLVINNTKCIDQEFRVKTDHNILAFFVDIDLFFHGTHRGVDLQFHRSILDVDDDRFFVAFFEKKRRTVDTA